MTPPCTRRPVRVTGALLEDLGACGRDRDLFADLFPEGCYLSLRNARAALGAGIDVSWYLSHPNVRGTLTRAELTTLAHCEGSACVRSEVAENPHTDWHTLGVLAKDADPWVRGHVASNPSTSAHTVCAMAEDEINGQMEGGLVWCKLAQRRDVGEGTLWKLYLSGSKYVRRSVVCNLRCPADLRAVACKDEDYTVRERAIEHTPDGVE